jgi:hypothetical protein
MESLTRALLLSLRVGTAMETHMYIGGGAIVIILILFLLLH